jgi:SpoVK/Ycf46/Vps4 family AAA+-type ATPase
VVGAGEIGMKAEELETNLKRIFTITSIWSAVVLIDEADVFLEKRSTADLDRNAIVAVLLRQLEYFPGILFLTTNREIVFDEALKSRIHVSIHYPDLDPVAKEKIWLAFLSRAGIKDKDLISWRQDAVQRLKNVPINGRQIKNTVNTAMVLARHKKEALRSDHIFQVLRMNEEYARLPTVKSNSLQHSSQLRRLWNFLRLLIMWLCRRSSLVALALIPRHVHSIFSL